MRDKHHSLSPGSIFIMKKERLDDIECGRCGDNGICTLNGNKEWCDCSIGVVKKRYYESKYD